jgi:hypothetical protein
VKIESTTLREEKRARVSRQQSAKKDIWARRNKLRGGRRKTQHEEF